jgi:F420-non-reducing hydrogenase large subunit
MGKTITIDPITRLEGHGKITICLDDRGEVERAYFQIPELRGFEAFCVGRLAEDMPQITSRICGVCPTAHHMAATKALDALYRVAPPPAAQAIRKLFYNLFMFEDHLLHFYYLGGPDFIVGPDAPAAERNILGVLAKVGMEVGGQVIQCRRQGHDVIEMIGGRKIHPATAVPGGMTHGITEEQRAEIEKIGRWSIEFAQFSLGIFDKVVLGNDAYKEMILSDAYTHRTYYMGLLDENNKVNFYDGRVGITSPDGTRVGTYAPAEYRDWIAEHVEPWTYLKFPYLKKVGWKGFVDGVDSGVYCATPLSRLNNADGMATPLAQAAYERFYDTLAPKPESGGKRLVHHRLATHWARLIELLYAAERMVELATDPEITSPDVRTVPTEKPTEGVGTVEAPRGTLTHHYWTDDRGVLTAVNLVVGTTNNYAPMAMSVKKAAEGVIHKGVVHQGLLNRVEMAFRLYDPCFGCATHSLPGEMPLQVAIRNSDGEVMEVLSQNC